MKKIAAVFAALSICLWPFAQQNLGIRNSNYAGIQGALLNPASMAGSPLSLDVNILSADVVFDNTFLYVPKKKLAVFGFKNIIDGAINETIFYSRYDPQNPNKLNNVTFSSEILGPSFFVKVAKKHEIGFTASARMYANINDIPGNMAENAYAYFRVRDLWGVQFQDNSTRVNSMGWLEYGLHYAAILYGDRKNELKAGISLNYLQGLAAAYAKNTHVSYSIADSANLVFVNSSVDYGRTNFDDFKKFGSHNLNHGHGFGADIGFIYTRLKEAGYAGNTRVHIQSAPEKDDYVYRLGISLIDLGAINFNRNTTSYHLQASQADFTNWSHIGFNSNAQVDETLSAVFYNGDSAKSVTGNHFKMALPAAISLQADWDFYKQFFINATIIKGFGHGSQQGVIRPDVYSLTPRYETTRFEASVPVSLLYYHHLQPRVGFAIRYSYFFIGGDAPASLLKLSPLNGVDFYGGIHYFIPEKRGVRG